MRRTASARTYAPILEAGRLEDLTDRSKIGAGNVVEEDDANPPSRVDRRTRSGTRPFMACLINGLWSFRVVPERRGDRGGTLDQIGIEEWGSRSESCESGPTAHVVPDPHGMAVGRQQEQPLGPPPRYASLALPIPDLVRFDVKSGRLAG